MRIRSECAKRTHSRSHPLNLQNQELNFMGLVKNLSIVIASAGFIVLAAAAEANAQSTDLINPNADDLITTDIDLEYNS